MIGIDVPFPTVHMKLGLLGALQKSIETNKENAVLIFQVIGRLIKRQASLRQLDGGVILLLVIESLMGHDLSLRMKERIVQASFVFLLMLTVIVLYNDVVKLLPPGQPSP